MKPESGKIFIKDIRFDDKTHVKDGALYVNKEEVEKPVLEDDRLTGCHAGIAKSGELVRITSVKDVIEPKVKISGGEIFLGVIGKVSPQVRTGRTHALEGCCVVTVDKIVGFQEGVVDMNGFATDYCSFSQTYNFCVVMEPADGPETYVYEKAARMVDLKVAAYVGGAARELESDEIIIYETKSIFEQIATYSGLPKADYIHMLQSQDPLHNTYCYGVGAKQFIPTSMYLTEIMDGAIVSGDCIAPCDKVTTHYHFHNPVIEDCYKHHGKDVNFTGVILIDENVFLIDKERHSGMTAKPCNWMGLDGVLITEEGYGNPDTDLMMNCRKVERAGTKVVPIIDEFPGEDGKFQPLADVCEEADVLVSCGQGNAILQFPAMNKVIGTQDLIKMQIGDQSGCRSPDGSSEAELQIIITSTIANGFNKLAVRGY